MSGRVMPSAAAPRKIGVLLPAANAYTCTASTPVPEGAARSIAQPATVKLGLTLALAAGTSTEPVGCRAAAVGNTVAGAWNELVIELYGNATNRYGPGASGGSVKLKPAFVKWLPKIPPMSGRATP